MRALSVSLRWEDVFQTNARRCQTLLDGNVEKGLERARVRRDSVRKGVADAFPPCRKWKPVDGRIKRRAQACGGEQRVSAAEAIAGNAVAAGPRRLFAQEPPK